MIKPIKDTFIYYNSPWLFSVVGNNNTDIIFISIGNDLCIGIDFTYEFKKLVFNGNMDIKSLFEIGSKDGIYKGYFNNYVSINGDFVKVGEEIPLELIPSDGLFLNNALSYNQTLEDQKDLENEIDKRESAGIINHNQFKKLEIINNRIESFNNKIKKYGN